MSVTDEYPDVRDPEPPPNRRPDRMPPQDLHAEQSVLGSMLLSKDAIADVVEVLRGVDFYRPQHETVYDAVLDLYGRGEPADAVTVNAELERRGELLKIGGPTAITDLMSAVPTAANAGYYAEIVREKAILRRLVEAGTRITQLGYGGEGEVDSIVDRAQSEIYAVTDKRSSEDYRPLSEIMESALDEIEAIGARDGKMVGVPTGFTDLDALTNGLHPGQLIVVAARPGMGKALALDTPLPTPTGWTTMGEVRVGEQLLGADGRPTTVVAATEVMLGRPCYEVLFSDGTTIVADADHQWLTETRLDRAVRTTREIAATLEYRHVVDERRHIKDVVPIASVPVRCVEVDNEDHLYLASRAMIPTHNSALALDFARAASIKHGLASVIFSLEMGRTEITMRLLSAEARVPMHHIRQGTMSDDDWARLARRMGEVSSAPMFIDDSPNMTMMEIRAKARRLKQRHDLRLIVLDYLQLMTSGKKVESRQVEVSEFSRNLKLLAKELEVPVVALSQLNRGPEQRQDKRPQTSDLRESGCLTAGTRILRADTGAEVTLGELMESGERDLPVWSLDDRLKLVPRTMTHAFSSGVKEVFKVKLASGREIEATGNHPFLTYDGWMPLAELTEGSRVGIARHVPAPLNVTPMDEDEIVLLAHLIGDGSFVKRQPIRYASIDEANLSVVSEAAKRRFGITSIRDEYAAARVTTLRLPAPYRLTHGKRNPIAEWLDGLGLFGLRSHEKFVPDQMFSLPKEQVGLFLRHLWATDGCVHWYEKYDFARIYYASTSRRLADQVTGLLARFNICARIKTTHKMGYRDSYHVQIHGADNQLRFIEEIGIHGSRGDKAVEIAELLQRVTPKANVDTVPEQVWDQVRAVMHNRGMSDRELMGSLGSSQVALNTKHSVGRERLAKIAVALDSSDLEMLATNDVLWDRITAIESLGDQKVFDATVMGLHNFIGNYTCLKNSIEQDADMVILLHRDDAYERESSRPGEADIIVAKHRNGPTANITVAFQGHYSRFVDMAQG